MSSNKSATANTAKTHASITTGSPSFSIRLMTCRKSIQTLSVYQVTDLIERASALSPPPNLALSLVFKHISKAHKALVAPA